LKVAPRAERVHDADQICKMDFGSHVYVTIFLFPRLLCAHLRDKLK
jgi:hypothetical protein